MDCASKASLAGKQDARVDVAARKKKAAASSDTPEQIGIDFLALDDAQHLAPDKVEHVLPDSARDDPQSCIPAWPCLLSKSLNARCKPDLEQFLRAN